MRKLPLLSSRALHTPASPIRKLSPYSRKAEAAGKKIYHLNIGQPDYPSPKSFLKALNDYQTNTVSYEISEGNYLLRKNWSDYLNTNSKLNISAEEILITTGASEALIFSFMVCCDPGSEIIVFDPTYANYLGFAAISGINLVPVLTRLDEDFVLPKEIEITRQINSNTRAILICNPNNPSGSLYSKQDLQNLLNICEKHNLFLIVDETYREIVYDDIKPLSILEIATNNPRVIVIDSLSKQFSLCGARIGAIITSNQEFLEQTLSLAQARLASPTIEQYAAAKMFKNLSADYMPQVTTEYQKRRDALVAGLHNISGIDFVKPQGAFYMLIRLPVPNAEDFIKFMLKDFSVNNETVYLAPAKGFFITPDYGLNKARIAAVLEVEKLKRAIDILGEGLKAYNSLSLH